VYAKFPSSLGSFGFTTSDTASPYVQWLVRARDATGRRDIYQARWDLFDAAEHLREARKQNLDEASATTVTR
jgi:hypothetical protein